MMDVDKAANMNGEIQALRARQRNRIVWEIEQEAWQRLADVLAAWQGKEAAHA